MKVILLADVARVGRKHELVEVPDGHAHNYLIPRKLALPATPQNLARQTEHNARVEAEAAAGESAFSALLERFKDAPLVINAPANDHGHLFKGLRAEDVAKEINASAGIALSPSAIALERPIKQIGEHTITVVSGGREGTIPIIVQTT
ncbi:50S ribosomal protein L9 [Candidatus Kaiserbacteria bacterium]|nr:50S ribosomal protein L9 [Candidatus Kaiserbacteria bacterium]